MKKKMKVRWTECEQNDGGEVRRRDEGMTRQRWGKDGRLTRQMNEGTWRWKDEEGWSNGWKDCWKNAWVEISILGECGQEASRRSAVARLWRKIHLS